MLEQRIERAVLWAESHLSDDFSCNDLACVACLSEYHFRRIFVAMTGISPGFYIKRRRLTCAADSLVNGDRKIIDIALSAGFESQESFSRAFKGMFGVTPAQHRKEKTDLSRLSQPAMDRDYFNHLQKGSITMMPEIRTKGSFCVVGLGNDYVVGQTEEIPQLWDQFMRLRNNINSIGAIDYGICSKAHGESLPANTFHYTASTEVDADGPLPSGLERIIVPENTYAVFVHKGHISAFEKTIQFIWKIWLPRSTYTLAEGPDFELYDDRFNPQTGEGEIEVWVPIKA